jgi:chemosensory pili system protein ChpA (sensor histidine kinase/response regulator)
MKKVLVLEDDSFLQELLSKKLSGAGYECVFAGDIPTGLKVLESKPDIALVDLLLPGGSGYDVMKAIRNTPEIKNIPIIVFSNLSEEKDILEARKLGATEFMIKSNFSLDELVRKMKELAP